MPEETSVPTFYYASIGSRFVAVLIDGIILSIVASAIGRAAGAEMAVSNLISVVLAVAYNVYFLSKSGQTLGKQAMKIKVVTEAGMIPSVETALVRSIATYLSGAVLLIGYIWAFFNPKKQTWHDLIAKTYVVEAKAQE